MEYVLVSTDAELKDLLQGVKSYPLLVCAYPGADGDDQSHDNYAERNIGVFFVLAPIKEQFSRAQRTEVWATTQQGMLELKTWIRSQISDQESAFYEILCDAEFGKRSIDPEYNFMGNVGWSLKFEYTTGGM